MNGRRLRVRIALSSVGLLTAVTALASTSPTLAAWQDREQGRATFTAAAVSPPTELTCTAGVSKFDLAWAAPVGGVTRSSYTWKVTPTGTLGPSGTGTVGAQQTKVSLSGGGLLTVGTGTFELRAVSSTTGWSSPAATATLNVAFGLLTSCTVP